MCAKVALITGITGQDGSYLAEILLDKGYEVHGIVRRASTFNRERIDHLFSDAKIIDKYINLHYGDLEDSNSLLRILMQTKPDEVYNLAAQSHVGISFDIPEYTSNVTGVGTVRLLEAMRSLKSDARFYQASSSELYGKVLETPQTEKTPFYPRSPYGCAKAFSFYLTRNYRESYGMYACNGILFNHESPRRGKNFVTRKITHTLAAMHAGELDCLKIGNLEAKRDWGYSKEYAEGMWLMLQQEQPDDYILATGRTTSVREFLEHCLHRVGYDFERIGTGKNEQYMDRVTGRVIVMHDPLYYRPAEVDLLQGDASKAKKVLGWEPITTMEQLADIMLESDFAHFGLDLPAPRRSITGSATARPPRQAGRTALSARR